MHTVKQKYLVSPSDEVNRHTTTRAQKTIKKQRQTRTITHKEKGQTLSQCTINLFLDDKIPLLNLD